MKATAYRFLCGLFSQMWLLLTSYPSIDAEIMTFDNKFLVNYDFTTFLLRYNSIWNAQITIGFSLRFLIYIIVKWR